MPALKVLPLPALDEIEQAFNYDQGAGLIRWRSHKNRTDLQGTIAGNLDSAGHRQIKYRGRTYMASRLIWKLKYKEDPPAQIDHVNGARDDNRIENLRAATACENARNAGLRSDNTSGFKGVAFDKKERLYRAHIAVNGKTKYLGQFLTANQASMARCAAACELHGDFACSGVRLLPTADLKGTLGSCSTCQRYP